MKSRSLAAVAALALVSATLTSINVAHVQAQQGPSISLDRESAEARSSVEVRGSGFTGDCDVLLFWGSGDGAVLGRAAVSPDGTFVTSVRVPEHAAAGPWSVAAQGRGFGLQGCGDFSASSASAGLSVTGQPAPLTDSSIPMLSRRLRHSGVDRATVQRAKESGRSVHAIVQLEGLPGDGDLEALAQAGVVPLAYLNARRGPGSAYLASISSSVQDESEDFRRLVRGVHPLVPADKIDVALAAGGGENTAPIDALVLFFADVSAEQAQAALDRAGVTAQREGTTTTYRATLTRPQIQRLATEDVVQFVAEQPEPGQLDLDVARTMHGVDTLQRFDAPSATYLGLSGFGVQISIHDSGVDDHHGDFANRMIRTEHPGDDGDHGTHVASIAAGSGVMSNQNDDLGTANGGTAFQWRGMAPQAEIAAYGSQTAHDVTTMLDAIVNEGVDVSNHSYSYNDGQYDANAASIDAIIRGDAGIPARPVIFSAGNQGQNPQWGMNSGYFSLSKSCKNCIIVANLQNDGTLNGGSSHGPAPDGRLGPSVGAMGTSVVAAGADVDDGRGGSGTGNSYRAKNGTSMSTPAVTGMTALLLQQYAAQFGVDLDAAPPLPATIRALLVQTADDLAGTASGTNPDTGAATAYGAGPDYATGYGQVDAVAGSELMARRMFRQDQVDMDDVTDEHLVSVVPGQDELKVTVAWDDLAGTPNSNHAAPALVNDLDLLLVGPNGEVRRPLVMPAAAQFDCDSDASNGTQTGSCSPGADPGPFNTTAAEGTDRLNNLEQVVVAAPAPGLWRARVSVLNTDTSRRLPLGGSQSYAIAGVTGDRSDLSVSKSDSPDPATAGEALKYTVTASNDGPATAYDVTAVDTLPAGVVYVATDLPGGCVQAPAGTLTCSLGDIPSGQSRSFAIRVAIDPSLVADNGGPVTIFNAVSVSSSTPDSDPADNTSTEGTIVQDRADLHTNKLCEPDRPLLAGESGRCTVFVDNHGPSDARNVQLSDVLLSEGSFTVSGVTPSQGTCTAPAPRTGGQQFSCDLGTLPVASASDSGRATVTYELTSTEAADIDDLASVVSDTPDPDSSNDQAREHVSVMAVSDLSITKTGPASALAGTDAVYDLTIYNAGPSTATGVVIEDVLPAGVSILSVSGSGGATCTAGVPGNPALPTTCSYGTLLPGASRAMTIGVRIHPDTLGALHNDARVTSDTFDDDLANNSATVVTDVGAAADLDVVMTDSPDPVLAGEKLTYTITTTNSGPSTAVDVRITDPLPAGTSFLTGVDGNGTTVCALAESANVLCELGTMAPGETRTVLVTVLVDPSVPDASVLSNTVTVSSPTADPVVANNTSTQATAVQALADLWIDKTGVRQSGNPSAVIVYTLSVHNRAGCEADPQSTLSPNCGDGGPSDAQEITVMDKLPLDPKKVVVQYVSPQCAYDQPTHTVTCSTSTVPAGASVDFVIEVQVAGSVSTISNTATLTSSTADPDTSNNTNAVTVVVKGGTGKK